MNENLDIQKHLLYITHLKAQNLHCPKLRGVTAIWKNEIAHISFYFSEKPTPNELEDASDVCTEIIAHMPKGMLEENYIVLEYPKPLPNRFLAYQC